MFIATARAMSPRPTDSSRTSKCSVPGPCHFGHQRMEMSGVWRDIWRHEGNMKETWTRNDAKRCETINCGRLWTFLRCDFHLGMPRFIRSLQIGRKPSLTERRIRISPERCIARSTQLKTVNAPHKLIHVTHTHDTHTGLLLVFSWSSLVLCNEFNACRSSIRLLGSLLGNQ